MGRPLVFSINGTRVELEEVDPRTTVLQYIRSRTNLQGTKLSCGEGGCGACTVLLSQYDSHSKQVEEITINSCLAPLCSIDGCAITTTEGLKNSKDELHAVHKRLLGFHGSQCGFCTPGMSMSIYAGLRKASCKVEGQCNGQKHCSGPTAVEAEKFINGNICRCTGYRPILDVCKSFASDVDVEDLGLNAFWASKENADANLLPPYDPQEDPKFPRFLVEEHERRLAKADHPAPSLFFKHIDGIEVTEVRQWKTVTSLLEAFNTLEECENENLDFKLVVGNTSAGIYKDIRPQVYIDISKIPELQSVTISKDLIEVGAGLSLSKLIDLFETRSENNIVLSELRKHLKQIASEQVRNRASLGGNLILTQKFGFDSDLATILLGAGAGVNLASLREEITLPLEEFLSQGLNPGTLMISIRIPTWIDHGVSTKGDFKTVFKTYRASCRPNGNAVSYVNAAFLAIVDGHKAAENGQASPAIIRDLRLAFGALGELHTRAKNTEKVLVGKSVSASLLLEAVKVLREEIKSPLTVHKSVYRSSVVVGFFFEFFNSSFLSPAQIMGRDSEGKILDAKDASSHKPTENGGISNEVVSEPISSNGNGPFAPASKVIQFGGKHPIAGTKASTQKFATSKEFWPVAQPGEKVAADLQASGEAVYCDDIAPVQGTLYGAFVLSDKPPGKIVNIDSSDALESPGVVSFLCAKDIPGINVGFSLWGFEDKVFAEGEVESMHDVLGLLVSDSYEHSREAVEKIRVTVEEQAQPIYTIEDAIARESYHEMHPMFAKNSSILLGNSSLKGSHRIENAEVFCGSQHHFYMETQTAYAVPDEGGSLTLYCSTQMPDTVHKATALCLGIPMNLVRVIVRRIGGGFGGKAQKACFVPVSAALAAYKLKRPVKIYLDRQTDMRCLAGRHETKAIYSIDFNDDGKITTLEANIFADGGRAKSISEAVIRHIAAHMGQYDWGTLKINSKICKTDKITRGIVRGPGAVQGHFIAETVIEHVAAYLGIDAYKVRERNMHSVESLNIFFPHTFNSVESNTIPYVWKKLMETSSFQKRLLDVKKFNEGSRWVKRGIDMVIGLYETGTRPRDCRVSIYEDGSVVVEVGGTEMGQGLWTKVRQTVAYGLSKLWGPEAHPTERIDISRVRIVQLDSISLPNAIFTGGSTVSEASCQAALIACDMLVGRFQPFLHKLREQGATPAPWEAIIGMAKFGGVSLSAQGNFVPGLHGLYLNFGACVSEVEVDVLTGSTVILQTDLLYDCGRSLNPAIDIGQVEGAFVMGVGFYLTEEWLEDKGKLLSDGTWLYKPPTADNIPRQFHVELSNMKINRDRILSSKASGEPPILLAKSVHSAVRQAITSARDDLRKLPLFGPEETANSKADTDTIKSDRYFQLDSPASLDKVKALCGFDNVERYLASL